MKKQICAKAKNTKKLIYKSIKPFLFLLFTFVLLLSACSEEQKAHTASGITVAFNNSNTETAVIEHNGINIEKAVIEDNSTKQKEQDIAKWYELMKQRELRRKYYVMKKAWHTIDNKNDGFDIKAEEKRIKSYCKEAGFEKCRKIDRSCNSECCRQVNVSCADDDYDSSVDEYEECNRFDVSIGNSCDKFLTELENRQLCTG